MVLQWTTTLTNPGYWVCWDQSDNGVCDTMWWPNGGSTVKRVENLPPGTYYWQVRADTTNGPVYADTNTWWRFTVGAEPEGAAGGGTPEGEVPGAAASSLPVKGLVAVRPVGWGRTRRGVRRALTAVLLLLALLWPMNAASQTPSGVEYYHLDALGSVRVVTDANGNVVRRHDYKPFGEEVTVTFPNPDRQLFTGQERDQETGLDYFGARYYRPKTGRFTSPDPLGLAGGLNAYVYVENNPLRFVDPAGLQRETPGTPATPVFSSETVCDKKCQQELWRHLDFQNWVIFKNTAPNGDRTPSWLRREAVRTALLMRDWQRQLAARGDRAAPLLEVVGSLCQSNNGQLISPRFEIRPAPCGSLECPPGTTWLVDLHTHGLEFAQPWPSTNDILSALSRPGVSNFLWTPYKGFPDGAVFQYNTQGAWSVSGPFLPFWRYR